MDTLQHAIDGLLKRLDATPRNEWTTEIMIAMQKVKDLGHAEGFKSANPYKTDKPEAPLPTAEGNGHAMPAIGPGFGGFNGPISFEDKALANDKPTPEEELEDLGHEYIKKIAYCLGVFSKQYLVTPDNLSVIDTFDAENGSITLKLSLRNPTIKA